MENVTSQEDGKVTSFCCFAFSGNFAIHDWDNRRSRVSVSVLMIVMLMVLFLSRLGK